jgi:hypothetical protein
VPEHPEPETPGVPVPDSADYTSAPLPSAGGPGHKHHEGAAFRRGFTRRERWFLGLMLVFTVILSAGALISQQIQQNSFQDSQRAQGAAEQAKLCSVLLPLAALKAPSGTAADNPSRLYEQQQEAKLSELAPAVGCK